MVVSGGPSYGVTEDEDTRRDRIDRARTFNDVADLYALRRPTYPDEIVDAFMTQAHLTPGSRVVEIGPGTGQLTQALLHRGIGVIGVEAGDKMAQRARAQTAEFGDQRSIEVSPFEQWDARGRRADAVVSATAYHWVDPAVGPGKVAGLVPQGGAFCTIATTHVAGGSGPFFAAVQPCYKEVYGRTEELPAAADVPPHGATFATQDLFTPPSFVRVEVEMTYLPHEFVELLATYSPVLRLDPAPAGERERFLNCIERYALEWGQPILKRYLFELRTVWRK